MPAQDRKRDPAHASGAQRIGGDATDIDIDRFAGRQRRMQRARGLRLDADDPGATAVPRGDAADEATAADRDHDRVDGGTLLLQFHRHRALPGHDFRLVVGVHYHCTSLGLTDLAGGKGVGIDGTHLIHHRTQFAQPRHLDRGRDHRHEDLGAVPEPPRGPCHRQAVVAAGCGDDAGCGNRRRQHAVQRPARLERAGVLQAFELEHELSRCVESIRLDLDDRCRAHMRTDALRRRLDRGAIYHGGHYAAAAVANASSIAATISPSG